MDAFYEIFKRTNKNMKKIFKRRRNIERATSFRLEYYYCTGDTTEPGFRDFKTFKALAQWANRNEECTSNMVLGHKFALIDETWEPFTAIGKQNITLSDLMHIVEDLKTSSLII